MVSVGKASGKAFHAITNQHLALSAKRTELLTQRGIVHDTCIVHTTVGKKSWDKVMSSSEEIKPVAFSIVELHLAEGIS